MKNSRIAISVVIPAYNEEKTIGTILALLAQSDTLDEIIVVDDGSKDGTAACAQKYGARVISQDNLGKASAMRAGALAALSAHVLFMDGDLIGFQSHHLDALIAPLRLGTASMTIGLRDRGPFWNMLMRTILPKIGGERVISRHDFLTLSKNVKGFEIESAMNHYCKKNRLSVALVPLDGVTHTLKEKKYGFVKGFIARIRMIGEVIGAEIQRLFM